MNTSLYFLYFVTAAATVLSPGPGVLMTIMKSVRHGYQGAVWGILGVASGTLIMAGITVSGIGAMLRYSPDAYAALRVVGALYMVWLGIKAWRAKGFGFKLAQNEVEHAAYDPDFKRWGLVVEGVMLQMTNPMLIMFFFSVFLQFIDPHYDYAEQVTVLSVTYFLLVFFIHTGYSLITCHFRGFLKSDRAARTIYRTGAVLFWALAVKVVFDLIQAV